ncbi:hypothetical protein QBD00_002507 [Ochrobactrum sp. AN78]|nr:hypothetical protein [Ochrobactrum sp. AN78]
MVYRPHSQKSVFELEAIFDGSSSDPRVVHELFRELMYRKTARARALERKLERVSSANSNMISKARQKSLKSRPRRAKGVEETMQIDAPMSSNASYKIGDARGKPKAGITPRLPPEPPGVSTYAVKRWLDKVRSLLRKL